MKDNANGVLLLAAKWSLALYDIPIFPEMLFSLHRMWFFHKNSYLIIPLGIWLKEFFLDYNCLFEALLIWVVFRLLY